MAQHLQVRLLSERSRRSPFTRTLSLRSSATRSAASHSALKCGRSTCHRRPGRRSAVARHAACRARHDRAPSDESSSFMTATKFSVRAAARCGTMAESRCDIASDTRVLGSYLHVRSEGGAGPTCWNAWGKDMLHRGGAGIAKHPGLIGWFTNIVHDRRRFVHAYRSRAVCAAMCMAT